MIPGVTFTHTFIEGPDSLFDFLSREIEWDTRMRARKTASFGLAYNYSNMTYPDLVMLPEIAKIASNIGKELDFLPNNCLVNYYANGKSKMGYHADRIDNLEANCGIAIVSLGTTRVLRFRNILNRALTFDCTLNSGSFLYMTQDVQKVWQHAIPKTDTILPRMSLTFRRLSNVTSD